MNSALAIVGAAVVGYLFGSISGSLLLGRARGVDIRTLGSGNAGGTNAFRTQGLLFALGVLLIDIGKAVLACLLAIAAADRLELQPAHMAVAAALGAVAGHLWPVFHGFRGGKGAATVVGALIVLWPASLLAGFAIWALVLVLGGWVSLATLAAATTLWIASLVPVSTSAQPGTAIFLTLALALMLWAHRDNLHRLRKGNEHRFERVRILHRRRPE